METRKVQTAAQMPIFKAFFFKLYDFKEKSHKPIMRIMNEVTKAVSLSLKFF